MGDSAILRSSRSNVVRSAPEPETISDDLCRLRGRVSKIRLSADGEPPGGRQRRVFKRGANREPNVRVTIADNGTGFEPTARRIFEPLFTTIGIIGTGLGLWVAKQTLQNHRGTIQVRSRIRGLRKGITFSVTLPVQMT